MTKAEESEPDETEVDTGAYHLRLYVAGQTVKSVAAIANLRRLCETHLSGRYDIEVIDLMQHPHMAASDQILAIPTLVRRLPTPLKRIIGDLSNVEKVLVGLNIRPISPADAAKMKRLLTPCACLSRARPGYRSARWPICAGYATSGWQGGSIWR